jgi:hypothetical protein
MLQPLGGSVRGSLPGSRPTGRHPANQISPSISPGKAPSTLLFPAAEPAPAAGAVQIRPQLHEARPLRRISRWKPLRINKLQWRKSFQFQALNRFQRMPITTHCLFGINRLRLLLHPGVVHCGQEGIRCGRYPNLASFRTPAWSSRIGRQPYPIEFQALTRRRPQRRPLRPSG